MIYCACNCGELIPEITKQGNPAKFKHGHNQRGRKYDKSQYDNRRGKNHPNYTGGRLIEHDYRLILKPDHPFANNHGYVLEHRLVMEKYLGRYLTKEEIVHHINEDTLDNRIENLRVMIRGDHGRHHTKDKPLVDMSDRKCAECGETRTGREANGRPKWYHTIDNEVICTICYGWKWRKANYNYSTGIKFFPD